MDAIQVQIGGKSYRYEIKGTVGLVLTVERLLPKGEQFDAGTPYHNALLHYAAIVYANPKNFPTLEEYLGGLTAAALNQMGEYLGKAWQRLEQGEQQDEGGKKKD